MHPETLLQHLGEEAHHAGAVTPPIFQTSLFVQESVEQFQANASSELGRPPGFVYSRVGNPNLTMVERKLAALESTEEARVFASGMAAVSAALMSCLKAGDHVVCVDTAYGPTQMLIKEMLARFGISHTMVSGRTTEEVFEAVRPETTVIYLESPGSILFQMQDFRTLCAFAKERGIKTITDNSYSTPLFQRPAEFGVDLVVHSATKYLCGHSDVVAGAVCGSAEHLAKLMHHEGQLLGALLPPFPAWLMLRGLRTLKLRMAEAQRMGNLMAEWLRSRPEVACVFHAGADWHPQRELAQSQMSGSSSLLTFEPHVQTERQIFAFLDALQVFQLGVSWGGFESLAVGLQMHPIGWPEKKWVIRLYCGLEHEADLQADLDQALIHLA